MYLQEKPEELSNEEIDKNKQKDREQEKKRKIHFSERVNDFSKFHFNQT